MTKSKQHFIMNFNSLAELKAIQDESFPIINKVIEKLNDIDETLSDMLRIDICKQTRYLFGHQKMINRLQWTKKFLLKSSDEEKQAMFAKIQSDHTSNNN